MYGRVAAATGIQLFTESVKGNMQGMSMSGAYFFLPEGGRAAWPAISNVKTCPFGLKIY